MAQISVLVNKDRMKAFIVLTYDGTFPTEKDIINTLKKAGIKHGIKYEKIRDIVLNPKYGANLLIAEGTPPQQGLPGRLEIYAFERKKEEEKISEQSTKIDLREKGIKIITVKAGEMFGKIIPPTRGKPGKNVFGEEIPGEPGPEAKVVLVSNIQKTEDGTLIAEVSGELKVWNEGDVTFLKIDEILTIAGDVDFHTGNVRFPGKVVITGSVKPGFIVEAEGDVEITGIVEAANIFSGGKIKVRGIKGSENTKIVGKSLEAYFIENANIDIEETIIVEKSVVNSNIFCGVSLILPGINSKIVGGRIEAGERVEAEMIGSPLGTRTVIRVGENPKLKKKLQELNEELTNVEKSIPRLKNTLEKLDREIKYKRVSAGKMLYYKKLLNSYEALKAQRAKLIDEIEKTKKLIENAKVNAVVIARRFFYPGVRVEMFKEAFESEKTITKLILKYEADKIQLRGYSG